MSMVAISKSYEEGEVAEYRGSENSEGVGESGRDVDTSDGLVSDGVAPG
jgi:hypothetical protein